MKLLAIDSSILTKASISRQLTHSFVSQWQQIYPKTEVVYRDLHAQPINHLSQKILAAESSVTEPEIREETELSRQLISELLSASVLVIGAPMYNFNISSQLKAWIDRVVVAGKTFKYEEGKVKGLATGKQAYIVSTRGGIYSAEPMLGLDHQETYLTSILNFIGINDITFIRAEGVNLGEEPRALAVQQAQAKIKELLQCETI